MPVQLAVLVAPAPAPGPLLARVKRMVAWSGWLEGEEAQHEGQPYV